MCVLSHSGGGAMRLLIVCSGDPTIGWLAYCICIICLRWYDVVPWNDHCHGVSCVARLACSGWLTDPTQGACGTFSLMSDWKNGQLSEACRGVLRLLAPLALLKRTKLYSPELPELLGRPTQLFHKVILCPSFKLNSERGGARTVISGFVNLFW